LVVEPGDELELPAVDAAFRVDVVEVRLDTVEPGRIRLPDRVRHAGDAADVDHRPRNAWVTARLR